MTVSVSSITAMWRTCLCRRYLSDITIPEYELTSDRINRFWANEREGLKGFLDESVISKLQIISDFRWPDDAIENQATNEAPRAQFDLQPRDPESRIPGSWVD